MNKLFANFGLLVIATVLLPGCSQRVETKDVREFNHPVLRKARAKLGEGDRQSAMELLNRAIEENPGLAQAHLEAAQLYDDYYRDYPRAIYHYERYIELRPGTEKKEMIEGFIRKAKIAFVASVSDQLPGLSGKMNALEEENKALKISLRQVRENLARNISSQRMKDAQGSPSRGAPDERSGKDPSGRVYRVRLGDTLSSIAAREYQDPKKWKLIYETNRNVLSAPEKLSAGQTLKIPM